MRLSGKHNQAYYESEETMKRSIVVTIVLLVIDRVMRAASCGISEGLHIELGSITLSFSNTLHPIDVDPSTLIVSVVSSVWMFAVMLAFGHYAGNTRRFVFPLALAIFGTLSNNVDRLLTGAVSDPLMISTIDGWTAFNLADIMNPIGFGLFLAWALVDARSLLFPTKATAR